MGKVAGIHTNSAVEDQKRVLKGTILGPAWSSAVGRLEWYEDMTVQGSRTTNTKLGPLYFQIAAESFTVGDDKWSNVDWKVADFYAPKMPFLSELSLCAPDFSSSEKASYERIRQFGMNKTKK